MKKGRISPFSEPRQLQRRWCHVLVWKQSRFSTPIPRQFLPYEIFFFPLGAKLFSNCRTQCRWGSLLRCKLKVIVIYQRAVDQQLCVFNIMVYPGGMLALPRQVAWTIWWVVASLACCLKPEPKAGEHITGLSHSLQRGWSCWNWRISIKLRWLQKQGLYHCITFTCCSCFPVLMNTLELPFLHKMIPLAFHSRTTYLSAKCAAICLWHF